MREGEELARIKAILDTTENKLSVTLDRLARSSSINQMSIDFLEKINETANQLQCLAESTKRPKWMNAIQLGEHLGVTRQTVKAWREEGFIPFVEIHGRAIYNVTDVDEALRATTQQNNQVQEVIYGKQSV